MLNSNEIRQVRKWRNKNIYGHTLNILGRTTLKVNIRSRQFYLWQYTGISVSFFINKNHFYRFCLNSYGSFGHFKTILWPFRYFHLDFESKSWTRTKLLKINEKTIKFFRNSKSEFQERGFNFEKNLWLFKDLSDS